MKGTIKWAPLALAVILSGCNLDSDIDEKGTLICAYGQDQTCNDDPLASAIWGICSPKNTCECVDGFVLNSDTGRCRIPVCTLGRDQTCNLSPEISSIHGICQADGSCACLDSFELDSDSGKCL